MEIKAGKTFTAYLHMVFDFCPMLISIKKSNYFIGHTTI